MSYDRRGRKVTANPADEDTGAAAAVPARGRRARPAAPPQPSASAAAKRSAFPQLRVLPVLILVALVTVSIKANSLWHAFTTGEISIAAFAPAEAETAAGAESADAPAPVDDRPVQIAQADKAATGDDKPIDPVLFTRSEIELLQELSKRRKELDAREQAVIQKEGLLTAAEDRIEKKITELQSVKQEIEALIKTYEEQEEEQFKSLVSIYERMKPKDAAKIFDELEMDVLLEVFGRMKSSKSAPILAEMRPQRAKEITTRIAERREFPALN